jgi:uncharacterized repeat protein (TIGR01451 family)
MSKLINSAISNGKFNGIETEVNSNAVEVALISGLSISKESDKIVWADDILTFTLTIKNSTINEFENIIINDILDPAFVSLITDSVRINDIPAGYGTIFYNLESGLFTIKIPHISSLQTIKVSFKVWRKNDIPFILKNRASMNAENSHSDGIVSNEVEVTSLPSFYRVEAERINLEWRINRNQNI